MNALVETRAVESVTLGDRYEIAPDISGEQIQNDGLSADAHAGSVITRNTIVSLATVCFESPGGPGGLIMISVDISDPRTSAEFIRDVAEKFKLQRLASPPNTNGLSITLTGRYSAARFVHCWHVLLAGDKSLAFCMSQMRIANVVLAAAGGDAMETASLIWPRTS